MVFDDMVDLGITAIVRPLMSLGLYSVQKFLNPISKEENMRKNFNGVCELVVLRAQVGWRTHAAIRGQSGSDA